MKKLMTLVAAGFLALTPVVAAQAEETAADHAAHAEVAAEEAADAAVDADAAAAK